jgi:hypothetical protein
MTKAQALELNRRFIDMDSTIMEYSKSYSFKYAQAHMLKEELRKKDSTLAYVVKTSKKFNEDRSRFILDVYMGGLVTVYAVVLLTLIR